MAGLSYLCSLLLISLLHFSPDFVTPTTFTIINNCDQTIWPGLLSNAGVSQLPTTGFPLHKSESKAITPPTSWAGRLWGRTLCTTDPTTSQFTCQTGDCGSGKVDCLGNGAATPATLAEFTLDGSGGQDFYDVSLVDGYNLPMMVVPRGGSGDNCTATGCAADLNGPCPAEMRVMGSGGGKSVGCRSACDKFNTPEYCCSGEHGSPDTCKPSVYSTAFKTACPRAYSYAYDDRTSTFICGGSPDYTITFCPSPSTSQKAASSSSPDGQGGTTSDDDGSSSSTSSSSPFENSSMVYVGALDAASSGSRSSSPYTWTLKRQLPMGIGFLLATTTATAHWWWWLLWWALLGHH